MKAKEFTTSKCMSVRNIATYAVLPFALLLMAYVTANAQNKQARTVQKAATENAQKIADLLYLDTDTPIEQQSLLISNAEIIVENKDGLSFNSQEIAVVPPGTYAFGVRKASKVKMNAGGHQVSSGNVSFGMSYSQTGTVYSKIIDADVAFEAGKCYTLDYGRNKDKSTDKGKKAIVSLTEVTDCDLFDRLEENRTSLNDYLAWSKANPNALEGTYKQGKREITFTGNKIHIATHIIGVSYIYDGIFWFNENTIVVYTQQWKAAKNPEQPHDRTVVLYYELNDGILNIVGEIPENDFSLAITGAYTNTLSEYAGQSGKKAGKLVGTDISWRVEDGVMVVSGAGDIINNPPWLKEISDVTSVAIGDDITSLGSRAFAMADFSSIVIGKSVTTLKSYALFNCNNLTLVEVRSAVPPKVGSFAFMSTPIGKATLIVPAGSKAAYEKDKDWKKFGTIKEQENNDAGTSH